MTQPSEIILLHYTPFSEKAVVIHALSKQRGRCSFLVRNGVSNLIYFQPLNILECDITSNSKSSLDCAGHFSTGLPLAGIRSSHDKNAISIFVAEVLLRAIPQDGQDRGLYEWLRSEIMLLDSLEQDFSNFHVRFLMDFSSAMGFSPDHDSLLPFLESDIQAADRLLCCDFAESMLTALSGDTRARLCSKLLKYLEFHLETSLNVRSLAVLSELF